MQDKDRKSFIAASTAVLGMQAQQVKERAVRERASSPTLPGVGAMATGAAQADASAAPRNSSRASRNSRPSRPSRAADAGRAFMFPKPNKETASASTRMPSSSGTRSPGRSEAASDGPPPVLPSPAAGRKSGEPLPSRTKSGHAGDRGGSRAHSSRSRGGSRGAASSGVASAPGSRAATPRSCKRIMKVPSFKELYKVGNEVMPSTHSYIRVHFGKRISDGEECVVKIREKPKCFRSADDERSWRRRTESLLNLPLPESGSICKLFEVLEDNEAFYIVMERVRGVDLYEMLESEGSLSLDTTREILRHILASVSHLHMHNMIHKDLKLENVMINTQLRGRHTRREKEKGRSRSHDAPHCQPSFVKVIDFDTLDEWTPKSTASKDVVGTDQYIAQEAYAGKYSPLSDVFAVGVIAYKLLSRRFPFNEDIFDDAAGENWAGSPQMTVIRRRLKVSAIDYNSHAVFRENPAVLDLVSKMLSYNEVQRPTAYVALEHPFFKDGAGGQLATRDEWEELIDDDIIVADAAS